MKRFWFLAAGSVLAWGCFGPGSEKPELPKGPISANGEDQGGSKDSAPNGAAPEAGGTSSKDPGVTKSVDPKMVEKIKELAKKDPVPRQAMKIRPTAPGWSASKVSASEIASKMDKAFASLPPALVDGRITYDTARGIQVGKPRLRVGSKGQYHLEYFSPEKEGQMLRIISDGAASVRFDGKSWIPVAKKGGAISSAEAGRWLTNFSEEMLKGIAEGKSVWQPVVAALRQGGSLQVQERTDKVGGKTRRTYRFLVSKSGSGSKADHEVVVDGDMWLPVTIRTEITPTQGKKEALMWTGRWAFGGEFEPKTFELPDRAKS